MAASDTKRIEKIVAGLRSALPVVPPEFFDAPVLDDWQWQEARFGPTGRILLSGVISRGHPRIAAGRHVFTSTVKEIDAMDPPGWARTQNRVYRLGAPKNELPLVVRTALAPSWRDAMRLVADATGAHTLPEASIESWRTLRLSTGHDSEAWRARRSAARTVAAMLRDDGRLAVADAWQMLAADPRDKEHARCIADILARNSGLTLRAEVHAALEGWQLCARAAPHIGENEHDQFVIVRTLGARERPLESAIMTEAGRKPPIYIQALLQPRWREAANFLVQASPPEVRAWLEAENFLLVSVPERRRIARDIAEELRRFGRSDLADGFDMIAVDPFDREQTAWVRDRLQGEGSFPGSDLLLLGWQRLSNGVFPESGENQDPVRMAWAAASLRAAVNDAPSEPVQSGTARVVIPRLGGTSKTTAGREASQEFKDLVGVALPLAVTPALGPVRARLCDEFPHLVAQLDLLLSDMGEGRPVKLAPTLLLGKPGSGKSRLARRLAEEIGIYLHRYDASGSADNAFAGTPRRWSTGEHCVPVEAIRVSRIANPWVFIDEIDKAGNGRHNGSLDRALLGFLETENARAYSDPYLETCVDLSAVGYILTGNEIEALPSPLRDRLRVIVLPEPAAEHLPQLARAIVDQVTKDEGGDPRWWPYLDDGELAIAETLWRGGTVRRLQAVIKRILAHRQQHPRH